VDTIKTKERIHFHGFDEYQLVPPTVEPGAQDRIASVSRLIAREAWRYARKATSHQRTQFDVDDLAQEAWVALLKVDHKYDATRFPREKGGYVFFARRAIRSHFRREIHRRGNPVYIPQKHLGLDKRDPITPEEVAAFKRGTKAGPISETSARSTDNPVLDEVAANERAQAARQTVRRALDSMPNRRHARLLLRHYGLLGEPVRPVRGFGDHQLHQVMAKVI
jgi:RNA polymerase sigma factor (sigma-70 family)